MAIDSHAHLDAPDFDPDRAETIARARNAGVDRILAIGGGTKPAELDRAIAIAEQFAGIDASIVIHPHEAKEATPESFDCLNALAGRTEVVAWGEIGL
ncbi:MAG: TatD family hydrolase, partial [Terriglobia bacterium]